MLLPFGSVVIRSRPSVSYPYVVALPSPSVSEIFRPLSASYLCVSALFVGSVTTDVRVRMPFDCCPALNWSVTCCAVNSAPKCAYSAIEPGQYPIVWLLTPGHSAHLPAPTYE